MTADRTTQTEDNLHASSRATRLSCTVRNSVDIHACCTWDTLCACVYLV